MALEAAIVPTQRQDRWWVGFPEDCIAGDSGTNSYFGLRQRGAKSIATARPDGTGAVN